ncbi:hypothetical protein BCR44DRAFT_1106079 [Catenaria anguillulae PL171]|uniref:Uncharacterized protein n=1 Tax=Catenaria anguillulae PL171 TaxID=765915 RepID=A0A1Y2HP36_9FUNG|nr:hypothetical protein BCR44DRAFT_1106079 [Catenaria anguillulae PL171]
MRYKRIILSIGMDAFSSRISINTQLCPISSAVRMQLPLAWRSHVLALTTHVVNLQVSGPLLASIQLFVFGLLHEQSCMHSRSIRICSSQHELSFQNNPMIPCLESRQRLSLCCCCKRPVSHYQLQWNDPSTRVKQLDANFWPGRWGKTFF